MNLLEIYNRASDYKSHNMLDKAVELFRIIVNKRVSGRNSPRLKAGAYFHLGEIYNERFHRKEAAAMFERCLKYNPEHKRARVLLNTLRSKRPPVFDGLSPVSGHYGNDRGRPLDRYYIETFLDSHKHLIKGTVLEVGDDRYTRKFGQSRVISGDILDIDPSNRAADLRGDLTRPDMFPENRYNTIILTQTLHIIFDYSSVLESLKKMIKNGGCIFVTLPVVSRIDTAAGLSRDCWRFTTASARGIFESHFPGSTVNVRAYGNVLTCAAFLYGYAVEEFSKEQVDFFDPDFPLIIGVLVCTAHS